MGYAKASMAPTVSPLRAADVRQRNEKIVLRLIHSARERGLSQSEVVLATGLKPPTIFRIFSSLEEAGYIEPLEKGEEESRLERKGRRPLAYVAKRGAFYAIGVEFWVERISIGVFDFQGLSVYSKMLALSRTEDAPAVAALIEGLVEEAISSLGLSREKILGLGLGAPGEVNVGRREVSSYQRIPGMKNFPIAGILEGKLGLPVFLHNNCSIVAKSEFRYGGLGDEESMFMFLLRSGVNGAFVDGGKVFLGPRGTTIEMGHISIDYDGPPCSCGARGCLEAFITALDRENLDAGHWLFESALNAPPKEGQEAQGSESLDLAAAYLASAVQTVSRLFRPSSFLFVAYSGEIAEELARRVEKRLSESRSTFDAVQPRFLGRAYDPGLAQRGAADLVIDAFLE
jgi:predicted NBD/HSP70 family sugar kinase